MRKRRDEIRDWLLENCVDAEGDLDLTDLDFSDFEGNVDISYMKVKRDLLQYNQEVGGDVILSYMKVKGDLRQCNQEVGGDLCFNIAKK